jgi:hypothetical protein
LIQSANLRPTKIGNYTKIYEVINTFGRNNTSIEFIRNGGVTLPTGVDSLPTTTNLHTLIAVAADPALSGNYFGRTNDNLALLSNRFSDSTNKKITNFSSSRAIIACQFSAPGGPEIQSLGYLDLKSQEFSVYNALPFRNLSVRSSGSGEANTIRVNSPLGKREGLITVLSRHCGKFGIDSQYGTVVTRTYPAAASFHKTHRNVLRRYEFLGPSGMSGAAVHFTASHDNYWVQHMIPRSDFQYSWITASLGTASLDPSLYAPAGAAWTGYIPRSGLVISSSTYVSAINWPLSDITSSFIL